MDTQVSISTTKDQPFRIESMECYSESDYTSYGTNPGELVLIVSVDHFDHEERQRDSEADTYNKNYYVAATDKGAERFWENRFEDGKLRMLGVGRFLGRTDGALLSLVAWRPFTGAMEHHTFPPGPHQDW